MQCKCEGCVAGRQRFIQGGFGLVNQWFDVVWGKAEAAVVVVVKFGQSRICKFAGKARDIIALADKLRAAMGGEEESGEEVEMAMDMDVGGDEMENVMREVSFQCYILISIFSFSKT